MSRILLSRYDDGSTHVVVGWDHPAGGAFWQEFASKQEIDDAENKLEDLASLIDREGYTPEREAEELRLETIFNAEVKREGGMFPGIKLKDFKQSVPEDLRHLITDKVMDLLSEHSSNPDSGYVGSPNRGFTDLTKP
jgi:hypothetical protein